MARWDSTKMEKWGNWVVGSPYVGAHYSNYLHNFKVFLWNNRVSFISQQ
jgi:hypothetical protein